MSFTDIQLRELEDDLRNFEHKFISIEACRALLVRVEAGERLLNLWLQLDDECEIDGSVFDKAMEAWRKSKGDVNDSEQACGKDGV